MTRLMLARPLSVVVTFLLTDGISDISKQREEAFPLAHS